MAGDLTREILARTQRPSRIRYGNVEAVSGGLASVRMGSVVVDNATWCRGYAPIVGDRVAVLASGSGWLILDAVERVQRAYNEPETIMVKPSHMGDDSKFFWSDSWDDNITTPGIDPKLPEFYNNDWGGVYSYSADGLERMWERVNYSYTNAGDGALVGYIPSNGYAAKFFWYPRLDSQVPSNAVIQSVSLVVRTPARHESLADWAQPPLSAPLTIHACAYPVLDNGAHAPEPPEFFIDNSYESMNLDDIAPESLVTVPLDDDLVTAMTDGTTTGLVAWSGETQVSTILADWVAWSWVYNTTWNYWSWRATPLTDDCMSLQVTYITPYEDD